VTRHPLVDLTATMAADGAVSVHGTAVMFEGFGVLFAGPSGSGKSSAALAMMALGATLISDDRVLVTQGPMLAAPDTALPAIEARHVGILNATLARDPVPFSLAISLGEVEAERVPPSRLLDLGHACVPLIFARGHPNLAPVVVQYLRKGRHS